MTDESNAPHDEEAEDVEAHRRIKAGAPEDPGLRRLTEDEEADDEVEAHRLKTAAPPEDPNMRR